MCKYCYKSFDVLTLNISKREFNQLVAVLGIPDPRDVPVAPVHLTSKGLQWSREQDLGLDLGLNPDS